MLVDVTLGGGRDPAIAFILLHVGTGAATRRLSKGVYACGHWSFEHIVREKLDCYPDLPDGLECYGVCDGPEQFAAKVGGALEGAPGRYVVSLVEVRKADQPASGGWRWHKWGPYIGVREPQCEYLHDEPDIDAAWTFHIYGVPAPEMPADCHPQGE